MFMGPNSKKTMKVLHSNSNNKARYQTAINLITGHIGLNKHLHKITLADSPICPYCNEIEETVAHFIGQCPAHMKLRGEFFNTFYSSINDIIDNNNLNNIITYAIKTRRFLLAEDKDDSGVT